MQFLQDNGIIKTKTSNFIAKRPQKGRGKAFSPCRVTEAMKKTIIGIDVGGTTTKIVGFRHMKNGQKELISKGDLTTNKRS